jgi:N-acylneuraminate cytidylyltransferase
VVSVVDVPHRFHPLSVMSVEDGWLRPFISDPMPFDRYRRQNLPACLARNGPAVLASRTEALSEHQGFYGGRTRPYRMSVVDSLDIDEEFDLVCAAAALQYRDRARADSREE